MSTQQSTSADESLAKAMAYLLCQQSSSWQSHSEGYGNDEQMMFYHNCHISLSHALSVLEILEQIFCLVEIKYVTPLGFSNQFETQQSVPNKIFYVEGCWRCCFSFRVEASRHDDSSLPCTSPASFEAGPFSLLSSTM